MNDMRAVIVPKSDQLNADDLIGGPIIITISKVVIKQGEQPVSIYFDGDRGKPYKCCKSMAKVMVACWGPDANAYVGRSMTLYRDPKVKWAGMEVGGIRISRMTHLPGEKAHTMALTETKGSKKLFTVQPMQVEQSKPKSTGAYVREKLGACVTRSEVADLVSQDPVFLEHGSKPAVKDLVAARMESLPTDNEDGLDDDRDGQDEGFE